MGDDEAAMVMMMSMMMCSVMFCICSSSSSSIMSLSSAKGRGGASGTDNAHMKGGVEPGLWESEKYGGGGGKGSRAICPANSYITDVIGFFGQGTHTNAINAWCYNPDTHEVKRLFASPTCGNRDRPSAGAAFEFIGYMVGVALTAVFTMGLSLSLFGPTLIGKTIGWADARKNILKPQFGRKLWKYRYLSAPAGIYKWDVNPKDGEIHGINLHGLNGQMSGWIGGREGGWRVGPGGPRQYLDPVIKGKTGGRCPLGKVVVGMDARCGDRVDSIKFYCDVPRHKN